MNAFIILAFRVESNLIISRSTSCRGLWYEQQCKWMVSCSLNTLIIISYEHNFGLKPCARSIDHLDAKTIDSFHANTWLLSPPCQPFTQGGKRLDNEDARSLGLMHLMQLIQTIDQKPTFFFLENVPNFEISKSREIVVETLDSLGYEIKEFLLSPMQIGIPNDRRRYYLTARKRNRFCKVPYLESAKIHTSIYDVESPLELPSISTYLEDGIHPQIYKVPDSYILKRVGFRFGMSLSDSEFILFRHCKTRGPKVVLFHKSLWDAARFWIRFIITDRSFQSNFWFLESFKLSRSRTSIFYTHRGGAIAWISNWRCAWNVSRTTNEIRVSREHHTQAKMETIGKFTQCSRCRTINETSPLCRIMHFIMHALYAYLCSFASCFSYQSVECERC